MVRFNTWLDVCIHLNFIYPPIGYKHWQSMTHPQLTNTHNIRIYVSMFYLFTRFPMSLVSYMGTWFIIHYSINWYSSFWIFPSELLKELDHWNTNLTRYYTLKSNKVILTNFETMLWMFNSIDNILIHYETSCYTSCQFYNRVLL